MSEIWLPSDFHFGHKNLVRGCSDWPDKSGCRDFSSILEHDNFLLNEINKKVKPTDVLWCLGDFAMGFGLKERMNGLREQIKCESLFLLAGNHDILLVKDNRNGGKEFGHLFKGFYYIWHGKFGGHHFTLCHYALRTWPHQHHGSYCCYAHSHGSLPDDTNSLSLDVGMDTCLFGHEKYTPYSLEEVVHIMKTFKKLTYIDHHR